MTYRISDLTAVSAFATSDLLVVQQGTTDRKATISQIDARYLRLTGDTLTGALGIAVGSDAAPGLFIAGDPNSGLRGNASDELYLITAGAKRLSIKSNNVEIVGTRMTIGSPSLPSSANVHLALAGTASPYLQFTSTAGGGFIIGSDGSPELFFYSHTGNIGAETYTLRARLNSSGVMTLSGINLGNETLSAYDQGSLTPTMIGSTVAGTQTYDTQLGAFTRIGNRMFFNLHVNISAKDAAMSGSVLIGGLPSAALSSTSASVTIGYYKGFNLSAGYSQLCGTISSGTSYIELVQAGDNVTPLNMPVADIAADTYIYISGDYQVA